ncbi:MAG: DEAD/DEAH box helicase family protein [Rhodobacteraceae bacterium]|nr:DEAD/DEAH box helicase family protein [Paracoccaceae bacterium]
MGTFFDNPILNSPYVAPSRHWSLDDEGRPTDEVMKTRRRCALISGMPRPQGVARNDAGQGELRLNPAGPGAQDHACNPTEFVNELRDRMHVWRTLPNPDDWRVTPTTRHLLQHWRAIQKDDSQAIRPFFCQLEAAETAIFLAEVAPKSGLPGDRRFRARLDAACADANPDLFRVAMKLATGAGKTTVMAMLIAWQVLNAVRSPKAKSWSRGFLIVTPGITIRDRLRVLQPNDAESIYVRAGLIPPGLMPDMQRAKIVITNYHAFKLRETMALAKGTRPALQGYDDDPPKTLETEGQMIRRVMPGLTGPITVLNDEAHHCYRARDAAPGDDTPQPTGDVRREAEENAEAARLWISGLEAVQRQIGVRVVYDLSATPFFLAGSGWAEGTLFPWVVSDFSLMDAIECGIVKLPRVPVADNLPGREPPLYRDLWQAIGRKMPRKAQGQAVPDPQALPLPLKTAIDALYGHYQKTFDLWQQCGVGVPPVFIVVCNNTTNSKLLRDYMAGYKIPDDPSQAVAGRCPLFSNFDETGTRLDRPRTVLIDSAALEAGEDINRAFRQAHAAEIEAFRREQAGRGAADTLTDADILREVMNTIGKAGRLGGQVRCVVSVSMLTEGWDANTVTHILGLRAFGTRLICEQVIGRALRRLSYDIDPDTGHFRTEYADIMGIDGLNFSATPRVAPPQQPRDVIEVRAVSPARDHLEITFPRVQGYVVDLPPGRLDADFSETEPYVLTPEKVAATSVTMQGIVGAGEVFTLDHLKDMRPASIACHIAKRMIEKLPDRDGRPQAGLFPAVKRIALHWLQNHLCCKGDTVPAQLLYRQLTDEVCEIILGALRHGPGRGPILRAVLDPWTPEGSTLGVRFNTSATSRWHPCPNKSHLNRIITDSIWEQQLARCIEQHPKVRAYAKNHNLGFEVPYLCAGSPRMYRPDFLLRLNTPEPATLVVEVKGFRGHDEQLKANAMRNAWVPAVDRLGRFGHWGFAELTEVYDFGPQLESAIEGMVQGGA